jgi:hypothetical protein
MLAFEKDKSTVCGNASPSDVIHLNVGGTKMAVLRRSPHPHICPRLNARIEILRLLGRIHGARSRRELLHRLAIPSF